MSHIYDHIYDTCTKTGKRRKWSQGATMLIMFQWGVTKTKTLENLDLRPVLVFEIRKTKTP